MKLADIERPLLVRFEREPGSKDIYAAVHTFEDGRGDWLHEAKPLTVDGVIDLIRVLMSKRPGLQVEFARRRVPGDLGGPAVWADDDKREMSAALSRAGLQLHDPLEQPKA